MRFMPAVFFALAVAMAFGLLAASGVGDYMGQTETSGIDEAVNETASDEDIEFDPDEGGEDSFLGSTVAAIRGVMGIFHTIVFLPAALQTLGMPSWGAQWVGRIVQLLLVLGVYQIIRGTEIL